MNFENFTKKISVLITEKLGDDYELVIQRITKNNSTTLTGLIIRPKDSNIAPTVYAEDLYDMYLSGNTFYDILDYVLKIKDTSPSNIGDLTDHLDDYQSVCRRLVLRLINTEKNQKQLENTPHIDFLDLSIIVTYMSEEVNEYISYVVIDDKFLKLWNITSDKLLLDAALNTQKLMPATFFSINDILSKSDYPFEIPKSELLVLTNKQKSYGSICISYPHILEDLYSNIGRNFYVIPSSIHELLIFPDTVSIKGAINQMIEDVNRTCLRDSDYLSNHAYYYDHETQSLTSV